MSGRQSTGQKLPFLRLRRRARADSKVVLEGLGPNVPGCQGTPADMRQALSEVHLARIRPLSRSGGCISSGFRSGRIGANRAAVWRTPGACRDGKDPLRAAGLRCTQTLSICTVEVVGNLRLARESGACRTVPGPERCARGDGVKATIAWEPSAWTITLGVRCRRRRRRVLLSEVDYWYGGLCEPDGMSLVIACSAHESHRDPGERPPQDIRYQIALPGCILDVVPGTRLGL